MGGGGFTLIELIVVIVILAVLVGVTIGGIFHYVNEARKNVDIHNVNVINNALQDLRFNTEFLKLTNSGHGLKYYSIEWIQGNDDSFDTGYYSPSGWDITLGLRALINKKVKDTLPDGYPKLNTPNCCYRISCCFSDDNTLKDIYCGVYSISLTKRNGVVSMNWDSSKDMKTYKRVY